MSLSSCATPKALEASETLAWAGRWGGPTAGTRLRSVLRHEVSGRGAAAGALYLSVITTVSYRDW